MIEANRNETSWYIKSAENKTHMLIIKCVRFEGKKKRREENSPELTKKTHTAGREERKKIKINKITQNNLLFVWMIVYVREATILRAL